MEAIKRFYKVVALPLFEDNYSYIVSGAAKNTLVLIDPANPSVVMNFVKKNFPDYLVSHVLYTHKHWDHAGGSQELANSLKESNPNVKIVIGQNDREFVKGANYSLSVSQDLTIGKSIVRTIHVPCHTRGHTIYSFLPISENCIQNWPKLTPVTIEDKQIREFDSHSCTFTGDTLFVGGIGRFFEGNAAQMTTNIEKMYQSIDLDSDIFCGHEYSLQNLTWGMEVEPKNEQMKKIHAQLRQQQQQKSIVWSIPSSLRKQREINIFVRAVTGSPLRDSVQKEPSTLLNILRQMKNKNLTDPNEYKSRLL